MFRRSTFSRATPSIPKPMLASPITVTASSHKVRKALPMGPYYVSPKLDGVRCLISRNGVFTRRQQRLHGLDKVTKALAPLFAKDRSLVLDGELYTAGNAGAFEDLISVVTRLRKCPTNQAQSVPRNVSEKIAFHCFDVVRMGATKVSKKKGGVSSRPRICEMRGGSKGFKSNGPPVVVAGHTPFFARLKALAYLKTTLGAGSSAAGTTTMPVRFVPHLPARDVAGARRVTKLYLSRGFEGGVLRCFDNKYVVGSRSPSMIKIVPWIDSEFRVLRFIVPKATAAESKAKAKKTKQQPKVINAVELITRDGVIFRAHVGVNAAVATQWLKDSTEGELTGVYATVRYPRVTSRGVPRFGVVKGIRGMSKQWFL